MFHRIRLVREWALDLERTVVGPPLQLCLSQRQRALQDARVVARRHIICEHLQNESALRIEEKGLRILHERTTEAESDPDLSMT